MQKGALLMEIIDLDQKQPVLEGLTLLLGNFDGFHKGHQALIFKARELETRGTAILLFKNDIHSFFSGDKKVITGLEDKIRFSHYYRIDFVLTKEIDQNFLALSPDEFIERIILPLKVKEVVVGEDFTYGKNGAGNVTTLKEKVKTEVVPLKYIDGSKVSSYVIKQEIEKGNIQKASQYLGRYYEIKGKVVEGLKNGKKIGFPTMNLALDNPYVLPKSGVYFGLVYLRGRPYKSIINVGVNPTIGKLTEPIVECHLLGFNQEVYGSAVYVEFISFIRDEQKFQSLEELKAQLEKDKALADNIREGSYENLI